MGCWTSSYDGGGGAGGSLSAGDLDDADDPLSRVTEKRIDLIQGDAIGQAEPDQSALSCRRGHDDAWAGIAIERGGLLQDDFGSWRAKSGRCAAADRWRGRHGGPRRVGRPPPLVAVHAASRTTATTPSPAFGKPCRTVIACLLRILVLGESGSFITAPIRRSGVVRVGVKASPERASPRLDVDMTDRPSHLPWLGPAIRLRPARSVMISLSGSTPAAALMSRSASARSSLGSKAWPSKPLWSNSQRLPRAARGALVALGEALCASYPKRL